MAASDNWLIQTLSPLAYFHSMKARLREMLQSRHAAGLAANTAILCASLFPSVS